MNAKKPTSHYVSDSGMCRTVIKKMFVVVLIILFKPGLTFGQNTVYDNFEGSKALHYGAKNGVIDTAAKNPAPDKVNNSAKCAKYTRSGEKKFDNIKMTLYGKLSGVSAYATYIGIPPQIKLKIYTTAPVGTLVEILLGSRGRNNEYPAGTHSQYQAHTTVSGKWEELEFKFSQIPEGSETSEAEINQVTLMFSPNSANTDTYYFDDLSGPQTTMTGTTGAKKNEKVNTTKKKEPQKKINPNGTE